MTCFIWVITTVVLQQRKIRGSRKELGFDIDGVEAFLPLSPKCALYMPCTSVSQQIISGYECALAAPENIRRAEASGVETAIDHTEMLKVAERVIHNSRELYRSLTEGMPFIAVPRNVENLNFLQCSWAHTAVYSNCGDFAFAKDVFRRLHNFVIS